MATALWVLERCGNERFPYRLSIFREDSPWLTLRVQDRWPTANRNIFCLRETEPPLPTEIDGEIERVPVVALTRRGPRLSVVLDRPRYKRCDFLFLRKPLKGDQGREYEQIFWQTQQSMRQRRPRARLVSRSQRADYSVLIAHDERYPWTFPGAFVERGVLPCGDYGLVGDEGLIAAVERKTFENLLADFGMMHVLHQRLSELAAQENHAFVIEAPYEDFLNPRKVHHYTPAFCARALGEIFALFPRLRIVFCSNRKTANEWTRNYFAALWALQAVPERGLWNTDE